jgi:hypothetical protein
MTNNSKYTEEINLQRLKKLYSLNIDQFISLFSDYSATEFKDEKMKEKSVLDKRNKITALFNYFKKNNNKITTTYKFGTNLKSGRRFADNPSLQFLSNDIRGLLVENIYNDYDMINAQPTLLLYLAKKNNLVCDELEYYIINREKCLNDFSRDCNCNRSIAKNYFIRCITSEYNVDKIQETYIKEDDYEASRTPNTIQKTKKIKNDFFIRFDKEIKTIQKQFYNNIFKHRIKDFPKKPNNKMGSFISYLLSELENEVLSLALKNLQDTNSVLIFDGFYSKKIIDIQTLNNITDKYGIKWARKDLDLSLVNKLDEIEPIEKVNIIGYDHNDISQQLLNGCLKNILVYCEDTTYFKYDLKYVSSEKSIGKYLFEFIAKSCIYRINDNFKVIAVHKHNNEINNLIEFIIKTSKTDNLFRERVWNNTRNKIYFQDGYYDFRLNKFIKNDKERLTFCYTNRQYNPKRNKIVEQEIYERILNPMFSITIDDKHNDRAIREQLRDNFLYRVSRMIGGYIEDKSWITLDGSRNSGKGVICDLLGEAFGDDYIKTTNGENFSFKNTNNDEAKANSFLCNFEFSKIVFTQEIRIDKDLDGNKLKKFASGGDKFEARTNFKDERNFRIQCGLIMCCNDLPNIKPTDAQETLQQYTLKSKFITNDEKQKFSNIHYFQRDNSIKTDFIKRVDVQDEFINMIFNAKYVEYPQSLKDEINNDEDNDEEKLLNLFEITKNKDDKITNEKLKIIIQRHQIQFKFAKCKKLLLGSGCTETRFTAGKRGFEGIKYNADC